MFRCSRFAPALAVAAGAALAAAVCSAPRPEPASPPLPALGFSDASHGWLVLGNAAWHTADSGRTWTRA